VPRSQFLRWPGSPLMMLWHFPRKKVSNFDMHMRIFLAISSSVWRWASGIL